MPKVSLAPIAKPTGCSVCNHRPDPRPTNTRMKSRQKPGCSFPLLGLWLSRHQTKDEDGEHWAGHPAPKRQEARVVAAESTAAPEAFKIQWGWRRPSVHTELHQHPSSTP